MATDIFENTSFGRIHLRQAGNPALPPLLLLHSNGRSAYEFDALAAELTDHFYVLACDLPGQGDSDPLCRHFSTSDYGRIVVELCEALFTAKPVVAGSSIGALLALVTGAEHPGAVAGIVPIELPLSRDTAWWEANWGMVETMFAYADEPEDRVRARYRELTPELAARVRIDRHKAGGTTMMDVLWAGRDAADAIPVQIRTLQVPALFINGDRGVATEASEVLGRLNPAVDLHIVADSGHFPHTDAPKAVANAIIAKFARSA